MWCSGVGLGLREQPTELPLSVYACRICPYRRGRSASSKSGQVDAQWLIPARHNAGCLFGHVIAAALVRPLSWARHPPVPAAAPNPACPGRRPVPNVSSRRLSPDRLAVASLVDRRQARPHREHRPHPPLTGHRPGPPWRPILTRLAAYRRHRVPERDRQPQEPNRPRRMIATNAPRDET